MGYNQIINQIDALNGVKILLSKQHNQAIIILHTVDALNENVAPEITITYYYLTLDTMNVDPKEVSVALRITSSPCNHLPWRQS